MKKNLLLLTMGLCLSLYISQISANPLVDTIFDRSAHDDFAFGADISWGGSNLKDKNGVPKDLLTILEEQGVNSVRYRVWYPDNGSEGKFEVVRDAKAAYDRGFKIMIDFHYSDSWADPGKQYIPSAWEGHTTEQLIQDVYDHTYDILDTLKKAGVTTSWVQIGNETKRGMLWPNGKTDEAGGMDNFAKMINSGYKAIKDIDTNIQAIVHLPDADENSLYRNMFDALKSRGAKWDIIGMSAYPHWAHLDWETEINMAVANMKDMISRYDTKVMVVETGHYWYEPYISNNFLVELMDTMMTFGGLGCFFWEPQAMFGYELTAWDPATRQPTIAMDAYLGIKYTNPGLFIDVSIDTPANNAVYDLEQSINLSASASHSNGTIDRITFYVNEVSVAEVETEPYSYELANPGTGIYTIYAEVTDSTGFTKKSETVTIQVGAVTMFQENMDGYCGITGNKGSIDTDHADYTGDGFINTDNEAGTTVNWTVNFSETGSYTIKFRYAATSTRPGTVKINGETIGTASFTSTGSWDVWDFSSIEFTLTESGNLPITVTATGGEGLPNIDYMSITSTETKTIEAAEECAGSSNLNDAVSSPSKIELYPVPAKNMVYLNAAENISYVLIYTINGELIEAIYNISSTNVEIPCNSYTSGLYIIQTTIGKETIVRKFSIIK